jgi:hypothetical protein
MPVFAVYWYNLKNCSVCADARIYFLFCAQRPWFTFCFVRICRGLLFVLCAYAGIYFLFCGAQMPGFVLFVFCADAGIPLSESQGMVLLLVQTLSLPSSRKMGFRKNWPIFCFFRPLLFETPLDTGGYIVHIL